MPPNHPLIQKIPCAAAILIATQIGISAAWAQSSCSSDGQRAPTALVERFISADCDTCWSSSEALKAKPQELALDWIVPGAKGDDAPLSAAATSDALYRLQAMNQSAPNGSFNVRRTTSRQPLALRVARGVALGGYMGASITLGPKSGARLPNYPMTAWLVMIEDIPAGTDGTLLPRHLVRNTLQISWNELRTKPAAVPTSTGRRLHESRPMSIPAGANPDRLRVVGWVENANGQVIASAAGVCVQ